MNLLQRLFGEKAARLPKDLTSSIGVGGAVVTGGYLQSAESDSRLTGERKYRTYSEIMTNTSIVAAGTRYFLNLVSKSRWKVEPADDSEKAEKLAAFVEEAMHDMHTPWHRAVRRAAMYRFYGFSVQEWTAKRRDDGKIGFADVDTRPQATITRWITDPTGTVEGCIQKNPTNDQEILLPREKLIYIVDDTLSDTPEGLGVFRHLAEPAGRMKEYLRLEGFGFESDLHGTPVARAPFSALAAMKERGVITETQRLALIQPLRDFVTSHLKSPSLGLMLDSEMYRSIDDSQTVSASPQWDMDVLRVGLGGSLQHVGHAIDRVNHDMARILGVEHLLMGGNDRGSYAMSKDKTANFYLVVDAAIQEITQAYETDWLKVMWKLNGFPDKLRPSFKPETLKFSDVDQIAQALRDMAIAGAVITPGDPAVDDVREILGISRVPESYVEDQTEFTEATTPVYDNQQQDGNDNADTDKPENAPDAAKPEVSAEAKKAITEIANLLVTAVKEGKL